jgi:hypothetical protein
MSIFSRKSKFIGQPVVINDAGLSIQDRVERAKGRVENLDRKLTLMLRIPKPTSDNLTMIALRLLSLK